MACKTVLKLLLSKFAPLSIELQQAVIVDQAAITEGDAVEVEYVDNKPETVEDKKEELRETNQQNGQVQML